MDSKNVKELVSLIVPVYNVKEYLKECIDSILGQTYKKIEVIVVDDGSTDGSHDICEEYKKIDDRIVLVTQENQGLAAARNTGLKYVNGTIVGYVDSDDRINAYMIEKMVMSLNETDADVVFCGFERFEDKTNEVYSREMLSDKLGNISPDEYDKLLYLNPGVWNKLYRIEVLKNIEFSRLRLCEDLGFTIDLIKKKPKISSVLEVLYYYRVRKTSIINSANEDAYKNLVKVLTEKRKEIENINENYELLQLYDAFMFLHLGISLTFRLIQEDKKNTKKYINDTRKLLDKEFIYWKSTKYLSLRTGLKKGVRGIGLWGCRLLYKIKMFRVFVVFYDFIQTKLHVDIKW